MQVIATMVNHPIPVVSALVCLFIIYLSQVSDAPDVQKLNCPWLFIIPRNVIWAI